jgi:hypothetical protein
MDTTVIIIGVIFLMLFCCCILSVVAGVGIFAFSKSGTNDEQSSQQISDQSSTTTDISADTLTETQQISDTSKTIVPDKTETAPVDTSEISKQDETTMSDETVVTKTPITPVPVVEKEATEQTVNKYQDGTTIQIPLTQSDITMSSQYNMNYIIEGKSFNNYTYGSDLVGDNDINTFAHTKNGDKEWILVTLKKTVPIIKVSIINRQDCCQDRIAGCRLIVMDENKTILDSHVINSVAKTYSFNMPALTYGKYVKLEHLTSGKYLNIAEIQIFTTQSALAYYLGYDGTTKPMSASLLPFDNSALTLIPISASQITMSSQHADFNPSKLLDNNDNTFAHTATGSKEWIKITLKKDIQIAKIIITNRKDCCQDRIQNSILEIKNSEGNTTYYHRIFGSTGLYTIVPCVGVVGKTITLSRPDSGYPLNIAGIQIYSRKSSVDKYNA